MADKRNEHINMDILEIIQSSKTKLNNILFSICGKTQNKKVIFKKFRAVIASLVEADEWYGEEFTGNSKKNW